MRSQTKCSNQPNYLGIALGNRPALLMLVLRVGWEYSPCLALRGGSSSPWCLLRKAVKATLVLLPLLGITYMLFFVNPGEDEISRIVFIYFNSFLESFQVWLSASAAIPGPKGCGGAHGVADVSFHSSSIPKIDLPKPWGCFRDAQPWGNSTVTLHLSPSRASLSLSSTAS